MNDDDPDNKTLDLLPESSNESGEWPTFYIPWVKVEIPFSEIRDIQGFQIPSGTPNPGYVKVKLLSNVPYKQLSYRFDNGTFSQVPNDGFLEGEFTVSGRHQLQIKFFNTNFFKPFIYKVDFDLYNLNNWKTKYELQFDTWYYDSEAQQMTKAVKKLKILEQGYNGPPKAMCGTGDVITIKYGEGDSDQIIDGVRPSRAIINLLKERDGQYDDIASCDDLQYMVQVTTDGNNVLWQGWVARDIFQDYVRDYPYEVTFTAVDGLSMLKRKLPIYGDGGVEHKWNRTISVSDLVRHSLRELKIPSLNYWVAHPWTLSGGLISNADPMNWWNINLEDFLQDDMSMYDLMNEAIRAASCRMVQARSGFMVNYIGFDIEEDEYGIPIRRDVKNGNVLYDASNNRSIDLGKKSDPGNNSTIYINNDVKVQKRLPVDLSINVPYKLRNILDLKSKFNWRSNYEIFISNSSNWNNYEWDFSYGYGVGTGAFTFSEDWLIDRRITGTDNDKYITDFVGFVDGNTNSFVWDVEHPGVIKSRLFPIGNPEFNYSQYRSRLRLKLKCYYEVLAADAEFQWQYFSLFCGSWYIWNNEEWRDAFNTDYMVDYHDFSSRFKLNVQTLDQEISILLPPFPPEMVNQKGIQIRFWNPETYYDTTTRPILFYNVRTEFVIEKRDPDSTVEKWVEIKIGEKDSIKIINATNNSRVAEDTLMIVDPELVVNDSVIGCWVKPDGTRLTEVSNIITEQVVNPQSIYTNLLIKDNNAPVKFIDTPVLSKEVMYCDLVKFMGEKYMVSSMTWKVKQSFYELQLKQVNNSKITFAIFDVSEPNAPVDAYNFNEKTIVVKQIGITTVEWSAQENIMTARSATWSQVSHDFPYAAGLARTKLETSNTSRLDLSGQSLMSIYGFNPGCVYYDFRNNKLGLSDINGILIELNKLNVFNTIIKLEGQELGYSPTLEGLVAKAALISRGCTVTHD